MLFLQVFFEDFERAFERLANLVKDFRLKIRNNIRLVRGFGMDEFLAALPGGLDFKVRDGGDDPAIVRRIVV